jgi:hypothetical protein
MFTKAAGERRHALKLGLAILTGFVVARPARSRAANSEYDQPKIGRDLVKYADAAGPDGQHCGNCANFIAPARCSLVGGEISPGGHCLAFAPKDMALK